jgi:hypothetical protein
MTEHEPRDLMARGAGAIYEKTGRRGFLAKTSGFLAALGLGTFAATKGAAADPQCCVGPACKDMGLRCKCGNPNESLCASGWHYSGYTWGCCLTGDRLFLCKDCIRDSGGNLCVCGCRTTKSCNLTVTELVGRGY